MWWKSQKIAYYINKQHDHGFYMALVIVLIHSIYFFIDAYLRNMSQAQGSLTHNNFFVLMSTNNRKVFVLHDTIKWWLWYEGVVSS